MAHYYQDVSHFRAPYKGVSVGAFGADTDGPTPPATTIFDAYLRKRPDGLYEFEPATKKVLTEHLKSYLLINPTDDSTFLREPTAEELAAMKTPEGEKFYKPLIAYNWVQAAVAKGFHVFTSPTMAVPAPQQLYLKLISIDDKASLNQLAQSGENAKMLVIIAEGQTAAAKAISTLVPLAIGVGAAAAVGIGILALGKRGPSGTLGTGKLTPNRRL